MLAENVNQFFVDSFKRFLARVLAKNQGTPAP